ncbi:MAG: hypothetical protein A3E79_06600, partial [Burkholderiales bacterium RIFCSPHIGHO2_12_FULL_61_11]
KANSRKIVTIAGRPSSIKSEKARDYEYQAVRQIPPAARQALEGPVSVTLRIFYASERPDLDESVILDVLQHRWSKAKKHKETGVVLVPREIVQKGVYCNDRQVREKHVFHAIDRKNPRAEITVELLHELTEQPSLLETV